MFLDKKTWLHIWLNHWLNLTIFRGTRLACVTLSYWSQFWGVVCIDYPLLREDQWEASVQTKLFHHVQGVLMFKVCERVLVITCDHESERSINTFLCYGRFLYKHKHYCLVLMSFCTRRHFLFRLFYQLKAHNYMQNNLGFLEFWMWVLLPL